MSGYFGIPLRNGLPLGLGTVISLRSGASWTPLTLFLAGEQGGWYDPSDVDRYMSELGPELANAALLDKRVATSGTVTRAAGIITFQSATSGLSTGISQQITGLTIGRTYRFTARARRISGGVNLVVQLRDNSGGGGSDVTPSTTIITGTDWATITIVWTATLTSVHLSYVMGNSSVFEVDEASHSFREVTAISTATLYQDSAGTTPVTAVEQPVGLWLDKRLGALSALGVDRVTNGGFDSGTTGWTTANSAVLTVGANGVTIQNNGASAGYLYQAMTTVIGRSYLITGSIVYGGPGFARIEVSTTITNPGGNNISASASGSYRWVFTATATTTYIIIGNRNDTNAAHTYDNISVREIPGNHLIQPTSASRPTYSKRYNLLTSTQAFSSGWAFSNCSFSAGVFTGTGAGTEICYATGVNNVVVGAGVSLTCYIRLKKGTITDPRIAIWNPSTTTLICNVILNWTASVPTVSSQSNVTGGTGGVSIVGLSDGSYAISFAFSMGAETTISPYIYISNSNSPGTLECYGFDIRRTIHTQMGMPAYQRVTTATDYDETGFLPRLRFDGADDSMYSAASVNFTATDEMTVLAGLTKLSDAATSMAVELSDNSNNNNGTFYLADPVSSTTLRFQNKGTLVASADAIAAAPVSRVVTAGGKISTDSTVVRVNGAQVAASASDLGAGNYGNFALFVGRRNNATLPFNGDIFQLILRGALTSGATLTSAEQYVAARTGVTLP